MMLVRYTLFFARKRTKVLRFTRCFQWILSDETGQKQISVLLDVGNNKILCYNHSCARAMEMKEVSQAEASVGLCGLH